MEAKKVDLLALSDFVVRYFESVKQAPISQLVLQKTLYYIQAYHLVYFEGHPLFDQEPEAWVRGPVYRDVYSRYKEFGSGDILLGTNESKENDYQAALGAVNVNSDQQKFLMYCLDYFGEKSPSELIMRTHRERPWNEARSGIGELDYSDNKITHEMMRTYYSEVVKENQKKTENKG